MSKYTYYDGGTYTRCTRKQALAFLVAQNGGIVYREGDAKRGRVRERYAWIQHGHNVAYLFENSRNPNRINTDAFRITPEMRQAAQKEIGALVPYRRYYLIDFVYAENGQQFGTGADLTPDEVGKLEAYLQELVEDGQITDPHVYEPGPDVHQTYAQARKEIAAAIRS